MNLEHKAVFVDEVRRAMLARMAIWDGIVCSVDSCRMGICTWNCSCVILIEVDVLEA